MKGADDEAVEEASDVCALPLVQRVAAMLDLDPSGFNEREALPRGWHFILFCPLTPQSQLGPDGFMPAPSGLGLERPRLMLGGRRASFSGDIPIGATVRRTRRVLSSTPKEGRSGRLVLVSRRQEIFVANAERPCVMEDEDMVYREAAPQSARSEPEATPEAKRAAEHGEPFLPDERLLFRYSMVSFNTHRIHYDHPYATGVEGYPGLVVNGGLTALRLLELHRRIAGAAPATLAVRHRRPLYCGRPAMLRAARHDGGWQLWSEDDGGHITTELTIT